MAKKNGNSVVNLGNAATDFYMRVTGANLGSKIGAGGLLAAEKGSKKIRKIFDKKGK